MRHASGRLAHLCRKYSIGNVTLSAFISYSLLQANIFS
jgi:hypothetical protein